MQTGAHTELVQALQGMLSGEDTGVAQKAIMAFKSLIALTESVWS